jgi:lipoate-protein ligase A
VEGINCRLLPFAVADGPVNMAADEVLLHSALEGTASLRFYGWSPPTLSLGYFQSAEVRLSDPLLAALPIVRRPSGGDTLVHDHELTYALALPPGAPWQSRASCWLARMHTIIAAALCDFGVAAELFDSAFSGRPQCGAGDNAPPRGRRLSEELLCFHRFTPGDLILAGAKILGSAQRKHRGALLQHGAILLQRSAYSPSLPGIRELTGQIPDSELIAQAICREFTRHTGWPLVPCEWTQSQINKTRDIAHAKYQSDAWNRKR